MGSEQPFVVGVPEPWMAQGRCVGLHPSVMFPADTTESKIAQAVCRGGCPVRLNCLRYALEHNEEYGIWGGYSERERRNRRALLLAECASTCSTAGTPPNEESSCEPHTQTSQSA